MNHRVFITGIGCISGLGLNASQYWNAMEEGITGIGPIANVDGPVKIPNGVQIRNYNPASYFTDEKLQLLDRFSQYAVIAAKEAVHDSGLSSESDALKKSTCIIGTACGGKHTDEETYRKLFKDGSNRVHPLTIPKGMPSASASMVSQHLGITGPVMSITSACASSAHAIIQGFMLLRTGYSDVALVGGSDAPFTYGLLKSWEALRVVSNDTCRPFSQDRSGMVLGEGAGMILLESEKHIRRRNVRCYGEIIGYGMTSDAGHITRPDIGGIAGAMNLAIQNAGIKPEQVEYINAHGTGTIANDKTETDAIHRVFGKHAMNLAVSSTKSMHGHSLGASSAMELIASVMTLKNDVILPTANFTSPGDGCDLDYVPNVARSCSVKIALSNSFAFGGLNAVIALRAV